MNNNLNKDIEIVEEEVEIWTPKIIWIIVFLAITYLVSEYFRISILDDENNKKSLAAKNIANVVYYLIFIFGGCMILLYIGVHWATILTILGTIGLTIGFAMQNLLKNVYASIYILQSNLFEMGDIIEVKELSYHNYIQGEVVEFDLYNTSILTHDKRVHIVPNVQIQDNIVVNLSRYNKYNKSGKYQEKEMKYVYHKY